MVRVLERIAADLDNLSLVPNDRQADKEANQNDLQARHRRELAESSREAKKLSHREQRTARVKKRLCVQKTERLMLLFCSIAPQYPTPVDPTTRGLTSNVQFLTLNDERARVSKR